MTDERSHAASLSPWWRHGAILVMIVGFTILAIITVETYDNAPPIPERVVDDAGRTIFTRADVLRGQEVFFKYGLMEHGTLWGHGAYLGPDYSAEYLHRLAEICNDQHAREGAGRPLAELQAVEAEVAMGLTRKALKHNRYDPATDTLVLTSCEAASLEVQ